MSTPSHRRREGREAFDLLIPTNPLEFCPYTNKDHIQDWLDGWNEMAVWNVRKRINKPCESFHSPRVMGIAEEDIEKGAQCEWDLETGHIRKV